jgi:cellulose synthase (UDP-forming)
MGIGGVPTDSVTEDILSTLVLLRQGFITRFLNEPLAFGLSSESISGMFVQRQRWCRGGLQLLFLHNGILGPGLTMIQRFLFFPTDWLVQTPVRLFAVLVPIIFLWTGLAPLEQAELPDLISYQIPVLVAHMGLMMWLSGGRYLPFLSTGFSLLLSFRLVPTIVATLIKPFGVPFRVTPKGSGAAQGVDHWTRGCAMFLLILTVLGLLYNALPETRVIADPEHRMAAFCFSVINAGALVLAILAGRDRGRPRTAERFLTSESVICELKDGTRVPATVRDASVNGTRIEWPVEVPIPRSMRIHLCENRIVRGTVVRERDNMLGVRFDLADSKERDRILLWAYSISVGTVDGPPSPGRLVARLAARCLK